MRPLALILWAAPSLIFGPAFVAQAGQQVTPGLLLTLGGFVAAIVGSVVGWRKLRPERDKIIAEAAELAVQTLRASMAELRDEVLRARAAAAEHEAEVFKVKAEMAQVLAKASEERHELRNDLAAREARIVYLERVVEDLRQELVALRRQINGG